MWELGSPPHSTSKRIVTLCYVQVSSPGNQSYNQVPSPGNQSYNQVPSPGNQCCNQVPSPGNQSCNQVLSHCIIAGLVLLPTDYVGSSEPLFDNCVGHQKPLSNSH
ncbi:20161_t:CDS:2, partial [Gigaspora rosea]